jgi:hypothetical protein
MTWKAYEEVHFSPNLIQRWVREGDEYVNRMTKDQMEIYKKNLTEMYKRQLDFTKKICKESE